MSIEQLRERARTSIETLDETAHKWRTMAATTGGSQAEWMMNHAFAAEDQGAIWAEVLKLLEGAQS